MKWKSGTIIQGASVQVLDANKKGYTKCSSVLEQGYMCTRTEKAEVKQNQHKNGEELRIYQVEILTGQLALAMRITA